MIKRIGRYFEKLGWGLRLHLHPAHRRAFRRMLSYGMKNHRDDDNVVACDFSNIAVDAVGGRYYAGMVRDFIEAGYYPVFVAHRATVSSFVTKGKKSMLLEKRFGVIRSLDELRKPYFLITDGSKPAPPLAAKVIRMVYERRLCRSEEDIEMPFFVHPYVGARIKLPHPYRIDEERKARIFFGGNTTEHRYSKNVIGENYGMLTRREMLAVTIGTAGDGIHRPKDAIAWLSSNDFHPFVMFETQTGGIPRDRWIDALASADFFLACPGVEMPLCHNLIEAMAAGAVPILQYANYLPVHLENRVNALTFHDAASLRQAVETALGMSRDEVMRMRGNVHEYYQKHLAPGCFARRLFGGAATRRNLLFNAYRVPR
jgi:hypothetical protein